jgi:hypothetical protein
VPELVRLRIERIATSAPSAPGECAPNRILIRLQSPALETPKPANLSVTGLRRDTFSRTALRATREPRWQNSEGFACGEGLALCRCLQCGLSTGNPRKIPLLAHSQIELEVGRPLVAPEKIAFPPGR